MSSNESLLERLVARVSELETQVSSLLEKEQRREEEKEEKRMREKNAKRYICPRCGEEKGYNDEFCHECAESEY